MQIDTKGRSLTQGGHKYLKAYEAGQEADKRAREIATLAQEALRIDFEDKSERLSELSIDIGAEEVAIAESEVA